MKRKIFCTALTIMIMSSSLAFAESFSETLENFVTVPDSLIKQSDPKTMFEDRLKLLPEEQKVIMPFEINGEIEIFVSKDGYIDGDGTFERPYNNITSAIKRIERLSYNDRSKGVVLYFREGEYAITNCINLRNEFSGLKDTPIYISSYNGERVVFSSAESIPLSEFKPVSDDAVLNRFQEKVRDKIVEVSLPEQGITYYGNVYYNDEHNKTYSEVEATLFSGTEILTLARYPNNNELRIGELVDAGPAKKDPDTGLGHEWVMADDRALSWEFNDDIGVHVYYSYNYEPEWKRIMSFDHDNNTVRCHGKVNNPGGYFRQTPENTYFFYNVMEELDSAGEWYLDRKTGKLYMYPLANSDENTVIYFSTKDNDIINASGANNIVINGIIFQNSAAKAIFVENSERFIIQNCDFISNNVEMINCKYSGVTTCYALETNINIERERFDSDSIQNFYDDRNFIMNCFIEGSKTKGNKLSITGNNCVISHNFASDQSHGCFAGQGANWYLEYNESVGSDKVQHDGGAFYTGGVLAANMLVRYNYIHDHGDSDNKEFGRGIYFDEGGSDFIVYGNIVHGCEYGSFSHSGKLGVWYNNLFLENAKTYATSTNHYSRYNNFRSKANYNHESSWFYVANRYSYDPSKLEWFKRYPEQLEYINNVKKYQEEIKSNPEEMQPTEKWLLEANYFYIANNLNYGGKSEVAHTSLDTSVIENNYELNKESFRDYDNYDFTVIDEEILKKLPDWKQIPVEKIGLIRDCDKWRNLKLGDMQKPASPLSGYENRVSPAEIYFSWGKVSGAAFYRVIIAEDEEFNNVVYDKETGKLGITIDLDAGKHYYYKVIALSKAKTLDYAVSESEVCDFYTMPEAEANEVLVADKTYVREALRKARDIAEKIVEGDALGEYAVGTKSELMSYIANTQQFVEETNIQKYIDEKENEVYNKIYEAQSSVKAGKVIHLDVNADNWYKVEDPSALGNQEKLVTFTEPQSGVLNVNTEDNTNAYIAYKEKIPYGSFAAVKIKSESFEQWQVFASLAFEQTGYGLSANDLYSVILSKDGKGAPSIEMQKYKKDAGSKQFLTFENKGEIKENEWVDVAIGAIPYEGGTRFVMIADGKIIYDYKDPLEDGAYYMDSYFMHNKNKKKSVTEFKQSDITYEEIIEILK